MDALIADLGSRALVTGAAGFIGSHLAEALLEAGVAVRGVDCFNDNYGRPQKLSNLAHLNEWDEFEFVPVDLARGSVRDLTDDCAVVFHLAAEPGVRTSWGDRYAQYLRNNVLATQHLLEAIRDGSGIRMVYASSSSVYGEPRIRPTPESETPHPRSPYGQTKLAMEHLCELYHDNFGVDAIGLRYFTVYGPRQRPDMAFHRVCVAVLERQPFVIFGDGHQTRDFTYVADIVAATLAAAARPVGPRILNLGGGSPASLRDAVGLIEELAGRTLEVSYVDSEHGDVRDTAADTTLAQQQLGFAPRVGLANGLEQQFAWLSTGGAGR